METQNYFKRIADQLLQDRLRSSGAVLYLYLYHSTNLVRFDHGNTCF